MASTRTQLSRSRTTYEQYRELESSLHEISTWIGRTRKVLAASGSPAAETYLAATRAIRALREAWRLHAEFEASLFPRLLSRNLYSSEQLERIAEDNESIGRRMTGILDAPWPRSPQAGLQSIRSGVRELLAQLLAQIERDRHTILPAILRMDSSERPAAHVDSKNSELVAT